MSNPSIIAQLASEAGRKTGNYLVIVERKPLDPDHKKDLEAGRLTITEMLYLYSLRLVEVTRTELIKESPDGDFPYIKYNDNNAYRLELADAKDINDILPPPTDDVIKKALARFESDGTITLHVDHEECLKFVKAINNVNKSRIQKVIAKLATLANNYDKVNSLEDTRLANAAKHIPVAETIYSLLDVSLSEA